MKHQIELYSGLLEASRHAAASYYEPEKAGKYVQDLYTNPQSLVEQSIPA